MVRAFNSYRIEERSYVSYLKREIHQSNLKHHFSKNQIGEIDIIVAEMTSNLIKYAGNGEILYRAYDVGERDSIFEVLCIDKGEGITDVLKMKKDGNSTSSTLGHGLGAIERLSTASELYSIPSWGTIVYSMVATGNKNPEPVSETEFSSRALMVNKPREVVCGDGYCIQETKSHYRILFGDGLGHGQNARDAMNAAITCFLKHKENDPVEIIRDMHLSVRKTRGLVATVAICEKKSKERKICGVGNILSRFYKGIEYKNYMPYNGTIGLNIPNSMSSTSYALERNQYLIMCSDGITSRWDLNRFPSFSRFDNIILASCIYKDYARGTDDASVLITKIS